ncbi:alpha/beta fold hydrolase [Streptomyces sp. NPDC047315]|uniref:alpha/beta hydrolase n=1 Tax=Streptomyces sp. NPDC047315 TaxID=3155142 RepID=UPI0033E8F863
MKIAQRTVDGVFIEHAAPGAFSSAPPIVLVHGAGHGSWVWENFLPYFAAQGRDCYAFSWFNHRGSRGLPDDQFAKRSLVDTVEELTTVVDLAGQPPVLVTHSMGAIVAQKYAEDHPVAAQVHITPAICAEVGLDVDVDVDPATPVGPGPFEQAWDLYLGGTSEEDARRYYALFSHESPRAIKEGVNALVSVDRTRLGGPSLLVAAEHDVVVQAEDVRRSAAYFGSDYLFLHGRSHNVALEPRWRETAHRIHSWLTHKTW